MRELRVMEIELSERNHELERAHLDRYETRQDLQLIIDEMLVPACQKSTDENENERLLLLELRTLLANRLQFDEQWRAQLPPWPCYKCGSIEVEHFEDCIATLGDR